MSEPQEAGMNWIRCPECGFWVTAPKSEPLPDGGPVCALGHEPVRMEVTEVVAKHG